MAKDNEKLDGQLKGLREQSREKIETGSEQHEEKRQRDKFRNLPDAVKKMIREAKESEEKE